jgi:hypothetical protein
MKTLDRDQRGGPIGARGGMGHPKQAGGLDIVTTDDGCIVTVPGQPRLHYLNATAVLILELCNGENSQEQIVELVKNAYGLPEPPVEDVREALKHLRDAGLLLRSGNQPAPRTR